MKNCSYLFTLFFILLWMKPLSAQKDPMTFIEKGQFNRAEKMIQKTLKNSPKDAESHLIMAKLQRIPGYKGYDLKEAYRSVLTAIDLFKRDSVTNASSYASAKDELTQITSKAAQEISQAPSLEKLERFIIDYNRAPASVRMRIMRQRDSAAFFLAAQKNSASDYVLYIKKYPESHMLDMAWQKLYDLRYAKALATNTIDGYKEFLTLCPNALQYDGVLQIIHKREFDRAKELMTIESMRNYLLEYPESPFFQDAEQLLDSLLYASVIDPKKLGSYAAFIEKYPKTSDRLGLVDSLYKRLYSMGDHDTVFRYSRVLNEKYRSDLLFRLHDEFTLDGEKATLDLFYSLYDDPLFSEKKDQEYQLAKMGDSLKLHYPFDPQKKAAYKEYIAKAGHSERAFVALQRLISRDIRDRNWLEAIESIEQLKEHFSPPISAKVKQLQELIEYRSDSSVVSTPFLFPINTQTGEEYSPVLTSDGEMLLYCGRGRTDNTGLEDIFVCYLTQPDSSLVLKELCTAENNEAPVSISSDKTELIYFRNGSLHRVGLSRDGWSEEVPLPNNINSGEWQADAVTSSDGKAILFSSVKDENYDLYTSNKPEGYHGANAHAADIYAMTLNEYGNWEGPFNLGPVINTPYCDRSPYLHPDMKTLYFSSSGHGGFGKLDVFKSTRLHDSCWNCWSTPVNLGKYINTPEEDWGYKISSSGEKAYFAKRSMRGDHDLFEINLPSEMRPEKVVLIEGVIRDADGSPVSAEVLWEDLESGELLGKANSNPVNGQYVVILPFDRFYAYYVQKEGYFPSSERIDLRDSTSTLKVVNDIDIISYEKLKRSNAYISLNNVFFEFGKYALLPESTAELKRLIKIIEGKAIKLEIAGHTDDVGTPEYNLELSEKRAISVRDFLISNGCEQADISVIGYGSSRPATSNDSDEDRSKNRRVEIRFL